MIALGIALYDYFWTGSGIDHTIGDLIVICAVAVLLCASALVSLVRRMLYWLRLTLNLGIMIGMLGSGVAGYFLETSGILAFLAIALLAWAVHLAAHSAVGFPSTSGNGARA
jgi:hypothetical protein